MKLTIDVEYASVNMIEQIVEIVQKIEEEHHLDKDSVLLRVNIGV